MAARRTGRRAGIWGGAGSISVLAAGSMLLHAVAAGLFDSQKDTPAYQRLEAAYKPDPRLQHAIANGEPQFPNRDVGFYLHVYQQPAAVIHLVERIASVFPGSAIYIMSDGGYDFTGLCAMFNCTFKMCPPANDRWNPWPFLRRMWDAAVALKTDYIVMLEPDNTVHRPIYNSPTLDAGGLEDANPHFHRETVAYVERLGKKHRPKFEWSFTGSGLAGGAYFRTAAVLDAFSDAAIADLNMTEIEILESKRVFSSDFMMPVVLAARGYTYAPWRDITQFDLRGDPDKKFLTDQPIEAALQHYGRGVPGGKPTYNLKLTPEMEGLYTTGKWATKSVVCHRCYTFEQYEKDYNTQDCTNRLTAGDAGWPTSEQSKAVKDAFFAKLGGWSAWKAEEMARKSREEEAAQARHATANANKVRLYGPDHAADINFVGWDQSKMQ